MKPTTQNLALLIILIHTTTIRPSSATPATTTTFNAANSFITFTCKSATYPKLCEATCLPFAPRIANDLTRMAYYAVNSTLRVSKNAYWNAYRVSKEVNLKPPERAGFGDCVKLTLNSVVQVKKSLDEVGRVKYGRSGKDMKFMLLNVRTWMSGAMTNYQTCLDSLGEMKARDVVKRGFSSRVRYVTMLSSNALAIVNQIK